MGESRGRAAGSEQHRPHDATRRIGPVRTWSWFVQLGEKACRKSRPRGCPSPATAAASRLELPDWLSGGLRSAGSRCPPRPSGRVAPRAAGRLLVAAGCAERTTRRSAAVAATRSTRLPQPWQRHRRLAAVGTIALRQCDRLGGGAVRDRGTAEFGWEHRRGAESRHCRFNEPPAQAPSASGSGAPG